MLSLAVSAFAALSLSLPAAAPDGGRPIALLPVAAERVSLEEMPQLQRLDDALRLGARELVSVVLQDEDRTRANLSSVRDMGISCEVDDVACLGKVSVLLDVDVVVVPIARIDRGRTSLRVLVVGGGGVNAEASRELAGAPTAQDARRVIEEALQAYAASPRPPPVGGAPEVGTSPDAQPASTASPAAPLPAVAAPGPAPPEDNAPSAGTAVPAPGLSPLLVAGAAVTAGGTALLVGGAAGALAMHALLDAKEPYAAREPKMLAGQVLVGAAVVGGVAALGGGALLAVAAIE